ncbi:MAG: class I SAM-dependent methyltransferase [Bacilli bacterium]|jgi:DNA modification methylase|nr:class I SAM-dependent methyltransferase [Bacilli bacterium]
MSQKAPAMVKKLLPSKFAELKDDWSNPDTKEHKMHSIHQYPAKFPSFIASKAFEYAEGHGIDVHTVGDVFCGCGTVALESELHGDNFWGCDISPVAVMIAKAKSHVYSTSRLQKLFDIVKTSYSASVNDEPPQLGSQRIAFWFEKRQIVKLAKIKNSIDMYTARNSKYRDAFYCIFSSILKPCSRWLSQSIKPQVDPCKVPADPFVLFEKQFIRFKKASEEINIDLNKQKIRKASVEIKKKNILSAKPRPKVDIIISSPPYVTSYEYADLHQLSTLWLGYAEDYRDLRKGTIGSSYGSTENDFSRYKLNYVGEEIVNELQKRRVEPSKVHAVARYYSDMETVSKRCYGLLKPGGMALFVVGDTEFKKVKIRNCDHLWECMQQAGFSELDCWKRRICGKTLSPYRDGNGRFSKDAQQRQIYREEYVIVGRKMS